MALRLDSGTIFDVGIWPLRTYFQFHLVLLVQKMLLLRLTWPFLDVSFNRTLALLEQLKIGK